MSDSTPDPAPFFKLRVRGSHPLWRRFPARFHSLFELFRGPYPAVHAPRFGLLRFRSPLLSESRLFSLPPPTEMFQFGGFPPHGYGFTLRYRRITPVGFPIQISADHLVFANPRRFSQLITSFFGSQCLGIHPVLFSLNHPRIPPGETLACVSLSSLCGCLHPQPQMSYSLIAICGFQGTIRIRGDFDLSAQCKTLGARIERNRNPQYAFLSTLPAEGKKRHIFRAFSLPLSGKQKARYGPEVMNLPCSSQSR